MSIKVNNITSDNIIALENIASSQSSQIQKLSDIFSEKYTRGFDQVTKQNVTITFAQEKYRFEIENPENHIRMYQVWKKDNTELNSNRKYMYITLKDWITEIFQKQKNFTPTTLIEIENNFYPTVMTDAKINLTVIVILLNILKQVARGYKKLYLL